MLRAEWSNSRALGLAVASPDRGIKSGDFGPVCPARNFCLRLGGGGDYDYLCCSDHFLHVDAC